MLSIKGQIVANIINKSPNVSERIWAKLQDILGKDATDDQWSVYFATHSADQTAELCGLMFVPGWGYAEYYEHNGVKYPVRAVEEPVGEGFEPITHWVGTLELKDAIAGESGGYPDDEFSGYLSVELLFTKTDEEIRNILDLR
jgi:hypothetical protein